MAYNEETIFDAIRGIISETDDGQLSRNKLSQTLCERGIVRSVGTAYSYIKRFQDAERARAIVTGDAPGQATELPPTLDTAFEALVSAVQALRVTTAATLLDQRRVASDAFAAALVSNAATGEEVASALNTDLTELQNRYDTAIAALEAATEGRQILDQQLASQAADLERLKAEVNSLTTALKSAGDKFELSQTALDAREKSLGLLEDERANHAETLGRLTRDGEEMRVRLNQLEAERERNLGLAETLLRCQLECEQLSESLAVERRRVEQLQLMLGHDNKSNEVAAVMHGTGA